MHPAVFSSKPLLTVLAGLSLSISSAFAAPVPEPASGDIFLGFRVSAISGEAPGTGADQSYLVNLGQSSQFTSLAAGTSITLTNIGNIGADLSSFYGSNWNTRGDLNWGVFGATDSESPSVYASRQRTNVNTQSIGWAALTAGARTATKNAIYTVTSGVGGYRTRAATVNSTVATFQENSSDASYYKQVGVGASDFGSQSEWTSIEGYFVNGVSGSVLDFYRIRNATPNVTFVGKFTISTSGVVTFTAAGGAPPVATDTDGDGFTDAQEIAAGTDPNNSSDFFRVQTIEHTGTANNVQFNTIPGRSYIVEYSESLDTGSWTPVGSPYVTTTTGGAVIIQDTDVTRLGKPRGFYRVKVTQ